MRKAVGGIGDAGFWGDSLCRDHRSRLQHLLCARLQTAALDMEQSCELNELTTLQIGKSFAYVGSQHFRVGFVLLAQPEHDLA